MKVIIKVDADETVVLEKEAEIINSTTLKQLRDRLNMRPEWLFLDIARAPIQLKQEDEKTFKDILRAPGTETRPTDIFIIIDDKVSNLPPSPVRGGVQSPASPARTVPPPPKSSEDRLAAAKKEFELLEIESKIATAKKDRQESEASIAVASNKKLDAEKEATIKESAAIAEAADQRQKILDRVRVTVGDQTTPIGKDMVRTELANKTFAPDEETQLFGAGGGTLASDYIDFFSLNLAQRDDLLDRVGFYRGIIVDPSRKEVASRSYRDLLRRVDISDDTAFRARLRALSDPKSPTATLDVQKMFSNMGLSMGGAAGAAATTPAPHAGQKPAAAPPATPAAPNPQMVTVALDNMPAATQPGGGPPATVAAAAKTQQPTAPADLSDDEMDLLDEIDQHVRTLPTKLLYRKPRLSGYYDTNYTFSEHVHQAQVNGVFSLNVSASVAYGPPLSTTKGGASAAFGLGKVSQTNTAEAGKTVYVTTSYFLPRIELSFDDRVPCASEDFVFEVLTALQMEPSDLLQEPDQIVAPPEDPDEITETAEDLMKVLMLYGHFVSRHTVIGGRLYGSQTKTLKGAEQASDVATQWSAKVKGEVSTTGVTAQAEAAMTDAERKLKANTTGNQKRQLNLEAVGGEGQFLSNAGEWAKTLGHYRWWSIVAHDDLVPAIDLLPRALAVKCRNLLRAYAETRTASEIMARGGHFLFYNAYRDIAGAYAQPSYFRIRNRLNPNNVLYLQQDIASNAAAVISGNASAVAGSRQIWCENGFGQIILFSPKGQPAYALTAAPKEDNAAVSALAKWKLVVRELGTAPYQTWSLSNSGHLLNDGFEEAGVNEKCEFVAKIQSRYQLDDLWLLDELPQDEVDSIANDYEQRLIEIGRGSHSSGGKAWAGSGLVQRSNLTVPNEPTHFPTEPIFLVADVLDNQQQPLAVNGDKAISLKFAGSHDNSHDVTGREIMMRPLVLGRHQLWHPRPDGRLVSEIRGPQGQELCLTWRGDSKPDQNGIVTAIVGGQIVTLPPPIDGQLILAPVDDQISGKQFWRYVPTSKTIVIAGSPNPLALEVEDCSLARFAMQFPKLGQTGFNKFRLLKLSEAAALATLPDWPAAKYRTDLLADVFGGSTGCKLIIANETKNDIGINQPSVARGSYAGGPPGGGPIQLKPGQFLAFYFFALDRSGDSVGSLVFSCGGGSRRFVFGSSSDGTKRRARFQPVTDSDSDLKKLTAQVIDGWQNANISETGSETVSGIACNYRIEQDSFKVFALNSMAKVTLGFKPA